MNSYPRSPVHRIGSPLEKTLFRKISREKTGTITQNDADGVERMYMILHLVGREPRGGIVRRPGDTWSGTSSFSRWSRQAPPWRCGSSGTG